MEEEQTKMAIIYTQLTTSEGEIQHSSNLAKVGGWILTVSIYPCCKKDNGMMHERAKLDGYVSIGSGGVQYLSSTINIVSVVLIMFELAL